MTRKELSNVFMAKSLVTFLNIRNSTSVLNGLWNTDKKISFLCSDSRKIFRSTDKLFQNTNDQRDDRTRVSSDNAQDVTSKNSTGFYFASWLAVSLRMDRHRSEIIHLTYVQVQQAFRKFNRLPDSSVSFISSRPLSCRIWEILALWHQVSEQKNKKTKSK